MRLESIALHGFKSFAERTELRVLPGITCVVGPNGCGKSNIADAIRWALGEQSPKTLRGHRMGDVIFHGAASRKPVGLAEVQLTFANDGGLSVPWSQVAVARRLYRTGESEYVLNGTVTRLREIQDLFAGTGVNPKAYALMDQDRLNDVLTSQPWERRVFIEEAAGVARYKQQRAETQGKLAATRQNLDRLRDVMEEVRRQLGSLERQARKARQYKALHQERQQLDLVLLAADWSALTARRDEAVRAATALRTAAEAERARIAQLAARQALEAASIQDLEYRLADLRQSAQKVQGEAERLLERREQMGLQLRDLGEERARLGDEVRGIGERRTSLAVEARARRDALAEVEARHRQRQEHAAALEVSLEQARRALEEHRTRFEGLRVAQVAEASRRVELTRSAAELRERAAHLERRLERLQDERRAAHEEGRRLAAARSRLEAVRRQTGAQLTLLGAELAGLATDTGVAEAELAACQAGLAEGRVTLAARRSAREALERLEREREGYGAGVRAIFAAEAALSGVVGTVADLLDVPAGLETAVEAVLGDRLQWVVVERFTEARQALGYLAREGAGSATLLPLDTLPAPAPLPDDADEVRWAARLVGGPRPELLQHLLGRVGVVDHLDRAEMLWRKNGVVATYVTPEGECLSPTGRLSGGRRDSERHGNEHSLLGRKRAIRQLAEEIAGLEAEEGRLEARRAAADGRLTALRARAEALRSSYKAHETQQLASEKDDEAAEREVGRVAAHQATLEAEIRGLEGEREETDGALGQVARGLASAQEQEARLEGEMTGLGAALDAARATESAVLGDATACRVELSGLVERIGALTRDIAHLGELDAEFAVQAAQAEERRALLGQRCEELGREREQADLLARDAAAERDRIEEEVGAAASQHRAFLEERRRLEAELGRAQHELGRVTGRAHELDLVETEARVRLEELVEEARRRHGVESAETFATVHDPARDLTEARTRHADLTQRLEAVGPVNLVADDEYRELEERLGFLRAQHDDVAASIKDMERALRGMTRTAQERFQEAFEQVNRNFGEIFGRLFEGGRAELRIAAPEEGEEDPLELGVELWAEPRGKRLVSVTQMSGGERALTGLALLFAIFYYRPSPFCVLDEVDAPLDDANIHRFRRVLRELTSQTQFLVITHNRQTMDAADVLYGVTMEEPGLSRLVSVRLSET